MSKPLKSCCQKVVCDMQAVGELGSALQLFLAASPFILILPDLLMPGSTSEAVETLSEKIVQMTGEKIVTNVTKTGSLPDFEDSVRAVNAITLNRMNQLAQIHSLRHASGTEGQLWKALKEIYDPKGEIRSGGGGWDWNPFW